MTQLYIIAGEASGDFIGSNIMRQLKQINPHISFLGIGGPLMEREGLKSLFSITKISLMGFLEILPHIFKIRKLINLTVQDIQKHQPQILVTIDSPGFTYRVAKRVRQLNPHLMMTHIVAPSVWAYKPGRAKKYALVYDHLLALLPFEPPYFTKEGLTCTYIGHPILEQKFYQKSHQKEEGNKKELVICVTAGSRQGEIVRHLLVFIESLNIIQKKYPLLKAIFVLAIKDQQQFMQGFLTHNAKFSYSFTLDRLKAYSDASVAIAKSGTNTLEIAASKTPMIVAYKVNLFSYLIIRSLIKIKYVSLINIISNKEILPEFIQFNCRPDKISSALIQLIENEEMAKQQVEEAFHVLKNLGLNSSTPPSRLAADAIDNYLNSKNIE